MARKVSTFDGRIRQLQDKVGSGRLTGSVERDQAYSQYQHEGMELRHPNGGIAKFQETALLGNHRDYLQSIANEVLEGDLVAAMADAMEKLDSDSGELAPKDTTILARSGAPVVRSRGEVVWSRPPEVPRLTQAELEAVHAKVAGRSNPRPRTGGV